MKKSEILLPRQDDNGSMGQKTNEGRTRKSIIFEKWMAEAINEIAETKGLTFTSVVLELLRQELAVMGYAMGIGRESADKLPESYPYPNVERTIL
jgi:hypothetical protein